MEKEDKTTADTYDERLKGTFLSVMVIGAFILIAWLAMLYFYMTTI